MSVTREEMLGALRERVAHLEIHRGRGRIVARLHELECMRAALHALQHTWGDYQEEDGYPGPLVPRKRSAP